MPGSRAAVGKAGRMDDDELARPTEPTPPPIDPALAPVAPPPSPDAGGAPGVVPSADAGEGEPGAPVPFTTDPAGTATAPAAVPHEAVLVAGRGSMVGAGLAAAVALAVVQLAQLAGILAQGLAISSGGEGLRGDVAHRIGFAFLQNGGPVNGLVLVVAAALCTLPAVAGLELDLRLRARRNLAVALAAGAAIVVTVGAVLAARTRVHVLDLQGEDLTSLTKRVLITYLVGTVGTAAVALGLAVRATRR